MQGIIQQAQPSKSGKTLSVQIGGQWYSTKHFELQNMIGQSVTFQTSQSEFNGTIMHWLNDYVSDSASTTPSGAAFDQAMAQQQPMGAPQTPVQAPARDRDASIIAQALTKACTGPGDDVQQVWSRYCSFYRFALKGVPDTEKPVAPPAPPANDFDDDIPF
jgi:hypothetical protein